ncbi:CheR family methyltransferase [Paenibacillus aurantiacus]|uniref:protein-glutamate O-methyltransferase n=1 Tax=Paenibacillus aurantiacus TaxID=1936118 RepID=A0ABV5KQ32_9BACL
MVAITDKEFKQLSEYVKQQFGIHLKEEKRPLVISRLQQVLSEKRLASFTEFMNEVVSDRTGRSAKLLVDKITTNHTFFMREVDHFQHFKNEVLPYLARTVKDKDLRIWSAGCSSGEEPYTLAMIMDEFFGTEKPAWNTKLLATDISGRVLDIAQKGIYNTEAVEAVPPAWRSRYFQQLDSHRTMVKPEIQREIIFRKFNLMEPAFPFKRKFHVIFCRNVMIYFDGPTKNELIAKYYEMTEPGGYLYIGHSESLDRESTRYQYIKPALYRKL